MKIIKNSRKGATYNLLQNWPIHVSNENCILLYFLVSRFIVNGLSEFFFHSHYCILVAPWLSAQLLCVYVVVIGVQAVAIATLILYHIQGRQRLLTHYDASCWCITMHPCIKLVAGTRSTKYLWAHNPNLGGKSVKLLLIHHKKLNNHVTSLHMPWQRSCHVMCKIVTWLDHWNQNHSKRMFMPFQFLAATKQLYKW